MSRQSITVFADTQILATGDQEQVTAVVAGLGSSGETRALLAFDDVTGAQIDLDLRETGSRSQPGVAGDTPRGADDSLPPETGRKPGRPKLGVVGREVTMLPRHWEWLNAQPGGASVTLRKLVEHARRDSVEADRVRRSQEATFRFMSAIAGNQPGFEEASRALFSGDRGSFEEHSREWPDDVRDYAHGLALDAFVDVQGELGT